MPSATTDIRKLRNGSIAVFDRNSKTLFVIPEALIAKFETAGSSVEAAESVAADPQVVKLTKSALSAISEAMAALVMLG